MVIFIRGKTSSNGMEVVHTASGSDRSAKYGHRPCYLSGVYKYGRRACELVAASSKEQNATLEIRKQHNTSEESFGW